ncbi:hypothetical protein [Spiroplasma endosymbiont of Notiophilus biguttatus]
MKQDLMLMKLIIECLYQQIQKYIIQKYQKVWIKKIKCNKKY